MTTVRGRLSPAPKRPRRQELEALRTLAFLAVVAQHVLGAYQRRETSAAEQVAIGVIFGLLKFAVPCFLFLSGVVLFLHYYDNLSYGSFLRRRLRTILLPYLCWAGIYWIYNGCNGAVWDIRQFVRDTLHCDISYHTWYVALIVQFYVLLPLIFRIFRGLASLCRSLRATACVVAGVLVLWLAVLELSPRLAGVPVLGRIFYDLRARNSLYYLGYFLLGGLCGLYRDAFDRWVRRFLPAIAAGTLATYVYSVWVLFHQGGLADGKVNLNYMGSLSIHMTIHSILAILLLYGLACRDLERHGLRRWCAFVGKHSYSAYLAHALAITVCNKQMIGRVTLPLWAYYALLMAAATVSALAAGWLFDVLWSWARQWTSRFFSKFPVVKRRKIV